MTVEGPEATPGAVSVRGRPIRRAPLGWVPWVALAIAAVVVLLMSVIAVLSA